MMGELVRRNWMTSRFGIQSSRYWMKYKAWLIHHKFMKLLLFNIFLIKSGVYLILIMIILYDDTYDCDYLEVDFFPIWSLKRRWVSSTDKLMANETPIEIKTFSAWPNKIKIDCC